MTDESQPTAIRVTNEVAELTVLGQDGPERQTMATLATADQYRETGPGIALHQPLRTVGTLSILGRNIHSLSGSREIVPQRFVDLVFRQPLFESERSEDERVRSVADAAVAQDSKPTDETAGTDSYRPDPTASGDGISSGHNSGIADSSGAASLSRRAVPRTVYRRPDAVDKQTETADSERKTTDAVRTTTDRDTQMGETVRLSRAVDRASAAPVVETPPSPPTISTQTAIGTRSLLGPSPLQSDDSRRVTPHSPAIQYRYLEQSVSDERRRFRNQPNRQPEGQSRRESRSQAAERAERSGTERAGTAGGPDAPGTESAGTTGGPDAPGTESAGTTGGIDAPGTESAGMPGRNTAWYPQTQYTDSGESQSSGRPVVPTLAVGDVDPGVTAISTPFRPRSRSSSADSNTAGGVRLTPRRAVRQRDTVSGVQQSRRPAPQPGHEQPSREPTPQPGQEQPTRRQAPQPSQEQPTRGQATQPAQEQSSRERALRPGPASDDAMVESGGSEQFPDGHTGTREQETQSQGGVPPLLTQPLLTRYQLTAARRASADQPHAQSSPSRRQQTGLPGREVPGLRVREGRQQAVDETERDTRRRHTRPQTGETGTQPPAPRTDSFERERQLPDNSAPPDSPRVPTGPDLVSRRPLPSRRETTGTDEPPDRYQSTFVERSRQRTTDPTTQRRGVQTTARPESPVDSHGQTVAERTPPAPVALTHLTGLQGIPRDSVPRADEQTRPTRRGDERAKQHAETPGVETSARSSVTASTRRSVTASAADGRERDQRVPAGQAERYTARRGPALTPLIQPLRTTTGGPSRAGGAQSEPLAHASRRDTPALTVASRQSAGESDGKSASVLSSGLDAQAIQPRPGEGTGPPTDRQQSPSAGPSGPRLTPVHPLSQHLPPEETDTGAPTAPSGENLIHTRSTVAGTARQDNEMPSLTLQESTTTQQQTETKSASRRSPEPQREPTRGEQSTDERRSQSERSSTDDLTERVEDAPRTPAGSETAQSDSSESAPTGRETASLYPDLTVKTLAPRIDVTRRKETRRDITHQSKTDRDERRNEGIPGNMELEGQPYQADIDRMAQRLYREIERKRRTERERRGL